MKVLTWSYQQSILGFGALVLYMCCNTCSQILPPWCAVNSPGPWVSHLVGVPVVWCGVDALPLVTLQQLSRVPDTHGAAHDLAHVGHQHVHLQRNTRHKVAFQRGRPWKQRYATAGYSGDTFEQPRRQAAEQIYFKTAQQSNEQK